MLTRTVAETAALLDVLAGYELGDATWAPPRPGPFAELALQDEPGRLRIGLALNPPLDGRDARPGVRGGARATPPRCSSRSATTSRRSRRRGRTRTLLPDFTRAFGADDRDDA